MSTTTAIQWTDATWNPVRGCSRVSAGCTRCYAEKVAARFHGDGRAYHGLTSIHPSGERRWNGEIRLLPEKLDEPLRWRKPRRIFVNSMSDLFHEGVPDEFIADVFAVMARAERHTFQVLTKRPERMRAWFSWIEEAASGESPAETWPLPNVHLGVSAENQDALRERLGPLCETPAAVRFLSLEPLLGPIDFSAVGGIGRLGWGFRNSPPVPGIDWVIVGGESGPQARPCDVSWIRSIVEQCREANVPCFVKQLGARPYDSHGNGDECCTLRLRDRKGGDMEEWAEDLRVREFPRC